MGERICKKIFKTFKVPGRKDRGAIIEPCWGPGSGRKFARRKAHKMDRRLGKKIIAEEVFMDDHDLPIDPPYIESWTASEIVRHMNFLFENRNSFGCPCHSCEEIRKLEEESNLRYLAMLDLEYEEEMARSYDDDYEDPDFF